MTRKLIGELKVFTILSWVPSAEGRRVPYLKDFFENWELKVLIGLSYVLGKKGRQVRYLDDFFGNLSC